MKPLNGPIEWLGFAPDMDPTTPGVITECEKLVPSDRGMITYPSPVTTPHVSAGPSSTVQAIAVLDLGNPLVMSATGDMKIYRAFDSLTGWTDLSPATTYAAIGGGVWSFDSFGRYALAAYGSAYAGNVAVVPLLASFGGNNQFQSIASSPRAAVMVSASGFVMLMNHRNDDLSDFAPDGWWCSGRYDHTDWTLTPGGSTRGRLVDSQGAIHAAIEFDGAVYAFKPDSIYRGTYVGGITVWEWDKLPFKVGCFFQNGVCRDESNIYFVHNCDIYAFDGANIRSLMSGRISNWFREKLSANVAANPWMVKLLYDGVSKSLVLMWPNGWVLVYHIPTNRFGIGERSVYESMAAGTKGLPMAMYPIGVKSADHKAYFIAPQYNSTAGPTSYLKTGDFGDDREAIESTEVRLRMTTAPATINGMVRSREALDVDFAVSKSANRTPDGKFELRNDGRWARYEFYFSGSVETLGMSIDFAKRGSR